MPPALPESSKGYLGVRRADGFQFGPASDINAGLSYRAIAAGEVDVIGAFATDGRIAAYNLRPLIDDRQFFPPYHAAPVVRRETLRARPDLRKALSRLGKILDDATMQELNFKVDHEQRSPAEVAREFLVSRNLLSGS